jgi:hypothetical protein
MNWPGHRIAIGLAAGIIVAWLAGMTTAMRHAALPSEAAGPMLAVFEPGTPPDKIFASIIASGAKPVRETWLGFVWVVAGDEPGMAGKLIEQGAIGTYAELPFSPGVNGCFAYADAKMAELFVIRP